MHTLRPAEGKTPLLSLPKLSEEKESGFHFYSGEIFVAEQTPFLSFPYSVFFLSFPSKLWVMSQFQHVEQPY